MSCSKLPHVTLTWVMAKEPRALMDWMRSYFLRGVSTMSCHHSADALFTCLWRHGAEPEGGCIGGWLHKVREEARHTFQLHKIRKSH